MAVRIADLKNNLSRHLARVRRGAEIIVYDRDTPVARLLPYRPDDAARGARSRDDDAQRLGRLVQLGVLGSGDPQAVAEWVEAHPALKLPPGTPGAVETLIKMRRESRR